MHCLIIVYVAAYIRCKTLSRPCSPTDVFKGPLNCFSERRLALVYVFNHFSYRAHMVTAIHHSCWFFFRTWRSDTGMYTLFIISFLILQRKALERFLSFKTSASRVSAGVKQVLRPLHPFNSRGIKKRCIDRSLLNITSHSLDTHQFRVHAHDQKFVKGMSDQNKRLVVSLP